MTPRLHFGLGAATVDRQDRREVAQRPRANARKASGRSRPHHRGAEVTSLCSHLGRGPRRRIGLTACACLVAPHTTGQPLRHAPPHRTARPANVLEYASPMELLYSPDWASNSTFSARKAPKSVFSTQPPTQKSREFLSDELHEASPSLPEAIVSTSPTPGTTPLRHRHQVLEVIATWPVSAEPSSVVEDRQGKYLFVANRISNDIAVLDAQTGVEEKRLAAGRGASYITPSPDGSKLYVTHVYPNPTPHRTAPRFRNHRHRHRTRRCHRPHPTPVHRSWLSRRFLRGWPSRCRRWSASQESRSPRASRARRRIH